MPPARAPERSLLKTRLFETLNVQAEFVELLGEPSGRSRAWRCFNQEAHKNGDRNASLSVDYKTSAWRCHACGEKGDIFTLYMRVKKWSFSDTLVHLARKYNLAHLLQQQSIGSNQRRSRLVRSVTEEKYKDGLARSYLSWRVHPGRLEFMLARYGLTQATLERWRVGLGADGRVWIPVFANKSLFEHSTNVGRHPSFVNVRKHDCFRLYAKWVHTETKQVFDKRPAAVTDAMLVEQRTAPYEPFYEGGQGKVMSIKDYGSTYLYPFEVLDQNSAIYLVGGELKALLLWQLGVPAVSFTTGEGAFAEDLLIYFLGKRVRVLMDVDEAGERAAYNLAQVLANSGAIVQQGVWPQDVKDELPPKGDVTDYLVKCGLAAEALELLKWVDVEPQLVEDDAQIKSVVSIIDAEGVPNLCDIRNVRFSDLTDPNNLFEWVKVGVLVSGRSEVPFVVPSSADVKCEEGRLRWKAVCSSCRLPECGFQRTVELDMASQIELLGQPFEAVEKRLLARVGTPRKCQFPVVTVHPAAAEALLLTPSVDMVAGGFASVDDFEYRHHPAVLLSEDKIRLTENQSYTLAGKIIPEPKSGRFLLAVNHYAPLAQNILGGLPAKADLDVVRSALRVEELDPSQVVTRLVEDVRDYQLMIYGQDSMLETLMLSFFLPFQFRLGQYTCERLCPSVMVLGDTLVGKSTSTKKLLSLYGAGRFADMGSKPTFAGLIGGNLQTGGTGKMTFSWGLLPTSHRALVAVDEYNKMDTNDIGALTNTMSSGIAERVTVNGVRKTLCHVRMLYLCNPRRNRSLRSFANPMDAALEVAGSPQDLGRIEYVHIQQASPLAEVYNSFHEPRHERFYTQPLARTHLQWAWNLTDTMIQFRHPQYVLDRALDLSRRFGHHTLLLPQQARFKLARLAAGFAGLTMSMDEELNLVVEDYHVDMALRHFYDGYARFLDARGVNLPGLLDDSLIQVLDRVMNPHLLRFLVTSERWSREDLEAGMGGHNVSPFLDVAQLQLGIVTRTAGYYRATSPHFHEQVGTYINERVKLMASRQEPSSVQR